MWLMGPRGLVCRQMSTPFSLVLRLAEDLQRG